MGEQKYAKKTRMYQKFKSFYFDELNAPIDKKIETFN
jgi:hypothetical protein